LTDRQITLTLPAELVEQAERLHLSLEQILREALEQTLIRQTALDRAFSQLDQLAGSLTEAEIEEVLNKQKAARLAQASRATNDEA
jgi:hypothetical protein